MNNRYRSASNPTGQHSLQGHLPRGQMQAACHPFGFIWGSLINTNQVDSPWGRDSDRSILFRLWHRQCPLTLIASIVLHAFWPMEGEARVKARVLNRIILICHANCVLASRLQVPYPPCVRS